MVTHMEPSVRFDADLVRRYDRPGPRYTSYPTAVQFHDGFREAEYRAAAAATNGKPNCSIVSVSSTSCTSVAARPPS
jgi:hypothetical protein